MPSRGSLERQTDIPAASDGMVLPWQVFTNYVTNLNLDILYNGTGKGVPLITWYHDPTANQLWRSAEIGSGLDWKFQNQLSARCIDVVGPSMNNYARVHQWDCYNTSSQIWRAYGPGYVTWNGHITSMFLNVHSGKCLSVVGDSQSAGAYLEQRDCDVNDLNQMFY